MEVGGGAAVATTARVVAIAHMVSEKNALLTGQCRSAGDAVAIDRTQVNNVLHARCWR